MEVGIMMQCNDSIWLTESILTQLMPSALPRVKDARPSHLILYTCLSIKFISSLLSCTRKKTGYLIGFMLADGELTNIAR